MPMVRFLKARGLFVKGDEIDMNGPVAFELEKRSILEWVGDPWVPGEPECAAVEAPDKAVQRQPKKRRAAKSSDGG